MRYLLQGYSIDSHAPHISLFNNPDKLRSLSCNSLQHIYGATLSSSLLIVHSIQIAGMPFFSYHALHCSINYSPLCRHCPRILRSVITSERYLKIHKQKKNETNLNPFEYQFHGHRFMQDIHGRLLKLKSSLEIDAGVCRRQLYPGKMKRDRKGTHESFIQMEVWWKLHGRKLHGR